MTFDSQSYLTRSQENCLEKSEWFLEKLIHNSSFWLFIESLEEEHAKKSQVYMIVCFCTQTKDEVNTTSLWSFQGNYYYYNDVLEKHESNGFPHFMVTPTEIT